MRVYLAHPPGLRCVAHAIVVLDAGMEPAQNHFVDDAHLGGKEYASRVGSGFRVNVRG